MRQPYILSWEAVSPAPPATTTESCFVPGIHAWQACRAYICVCVPSTEPESMGLSGAKYSRGVKSHASRVSSFHFFCSFTAKGDCVWRSAHLRKLRKPFSRRILRDGKLETTRASSTSLIRWEFIPFMIQDEWEFEMHSIRLGYTWEIFTIDRHLVKTIFLFSLLLRHLLFVYFHFCSYSNSTMI